MAEPTPFELVQDRSLDRPWMVRDPSYPERAIDGKIYRSPFYYCKFCYDGGGMWNLNLRLQRPELYVHKPECLVPLAQAAESAAAQQQRPRLG